MSQRPQRRFLLPESELPTHYYNIAADLPEPLPPPLHPATQEPIGPADLAPLFPMELIKQEVSAERFIEIPEPVRDAYRIYRPSPLDPGDWASSARSIRRPASTTSTRAAQPGRLAQAEHGHRAGLLQPGEEGVQRLVTETGAGQWGSALAFAGALFGIETKVFMVKVSYEQKPYRRSFIETFGAPASAVAVDRDERRSHDPGRRTPDSTGSLGIAISEALEVAATNEDTKYSLGSVLNHVLLHQTVIGQEAIKQMEMAGEDARRRDRLCRRRLELRGHRLPVPARPADGRRRPASWRSSRRPAPA